MTHKTYTLTQRLTATFIIAVIVTLIFSLLASQAGAFTRQTITINRTVTVSSAVDGLISFTGVMELLMFFTYSLSHEINIRTKTAVISVIIVGVWTAIALALLVLSTNFTSIAFGTFAQMTGILAIILVATVVPQVVN